MRHPQYSIENDSSHLVLPTLYIYVHRHRFFFCTHPLESKGEKNIFFFPLNSRVFEVFLCHNKRYKVEGGGVCIWQLKPSRPFIPSRTRKGILFFFSFFLFWANKSLTGLHMCINFKCLMLMRQITS